MVFLRDYVYLLLWVRILDIYTTEERTRTGIYETWHASALYTALSLIVFHLQQVVRLSAETFLKI